MTLTHLIPLSQFVDKIDEIVPKQLGQFSEYNQFKQLQAIKRYTEFLLQQLHLSMFVPVWDSGEALEEPKWSDSKSEWDFRKKMEPYNKAKEKCLFDGFECNKNGYFQSKEFCIDEEMMVSFYENIESLANHNLPLTAQAIKQILG